MFFFLVTFLSVQATAADVAADRALFEAIRLNDLEAVRAALGRGADVNGHSGEGDTPLMYAAVFSTAGCMQLLLDRKAEPNARDKRGGTALMRSVRDIEKVKLLVDRGAEVDAKSNSGIRALMVAGNNSLGWDVVKLLLAHNADPKTPDSRGIP